MNYEGSQVSEFYRGRYILITGATGFLGKVLVEKLLRSCSEINSIYLLMRPKSGVDMKTRFNELLNTSMFDQIKKNNVNILNKLVPIHGDITLPELGLSKEDQQLLIENVSVVFHSAATVKFDEALKESVHMNCLGTKKLVHLCQKMTKLEALVHVSTAYCNCNEVTVLEKVYPPPANPDTIIQCVESLDEEIVNSITPQIISNRPNTYTYTKALAENVLYENSSSLPIAIVRPSIVTAAWREPLQGWVDNLNGPTGIFVAVGKGILRTLWANRSLIADLIPVDIAINLMIVVAWHISSSKPNNMLVYNCSSGQTNPLHWGEIERMILGFVKKHPCTEVVWYPGGSFKGNSVMNRLSIAAFHTAPAYVLDTLTRICGKKPILVRIQKKLNRAVTSLEFFTTHEWKFVNNNMLNLYEMLSVTDKRYFNFNVNEVNWLSYMEDYWLGIRKYILKEDPSSIPDASRHLRKYYWIHRFSQLFIMAIFWKCLIKKSQTLQNVWYFVVSLLLHLSKLMTTFLQVT